MLGKRIMAQNNYNYSFSHRIGYFNVKEFGLDFDKYFQNKWSFQSSASVTYTSFYYPFRGDFLDIISESQGLLLRFIAKKNLQKIESYSPYYLGLGLVNNYIAATTITNADGETYHYNSKQLGAFLNFSVEIGKSLNHFFSEFFIWTGGKVNFNKREYIKTNWVPFNSIHKDIGFGPVFQVGFRIGYLAFKKNRND